MKTLILTIGLPHSGKLIWARKYAEEKGIPHASGAILTNDIIL